jgi:hypothetical protein
MIRTLMEDAPFIVAALSGVAIVLIGIVYAVERAHNPLPYKTEDDTTPEDDEWANELHILNETTDTANIDMSALTLRVDLDFIEDKFRRELDSTICRLLDDFRGGPIESFTACEHRPNSMLTYTIPCEQCSWFPQVSGIYVTFSGTTPVPVIAGRK